MRTVWSLFALAVILNMLFWGFARPLKASWGNIPPPPSYDGAMAMSLGDRQFAYRIMGLMLQNFGASGGEYISLTAYNYDMLKDWFYVTDRLDPVSDYVPALAAYYYGASQNEKDLTPIIDYLRYVGSNPSLEKWRWLVIAMYLARHRQNDIEQALDIAQQLAALDSDIPIWARQMPALIRIDMGDKEAAFTLMVDILKTEAENLDPSEVMFMKLYICNRILDEEGRRKFPLCD